MFEFQKALGNVIMFRVEWWLEGATETISTFYKVIIIFNV